jgi:hypothetical protein
MLDSFEGRWRRGWWCAATASWALGLGACGGDEGAAPAGSSSSSCTVLEPSELSTLDADVHVLASGDALGSPAGSLARALLPDAGDVYWYDAHGSVFVERQGDGRVVELRHGEPPTETHHEAGLGLAANGERLFVGYALRWSNAIDYLPLEYSPPGRLLSISKQDGQSEVLLELPNTWMAPITADAERVIVFAASEGGGSSPGMGFYEVPLAAPALLPLPLVRPSPTARDSTELLAPGRVFTGGQLADGEVYWTGSPDGSYPAPLLRAGFDDAEPEVAMQGLADYSFWVGSGRIMTTEDVVLPGYYYGGKDFVVSDDAGCRSVLGPRGYSVRGAALDEQSAYWSRSTAAGRQWAPADVELRRIDLENGAVARLNTPGFTPPGELDIVGADDTRLFIRSGDTLISLRKP